MSLYKRGDRIIGKYTGTEGGPLVIILGAIHGNETAGLEAIRLVLKMIEVEPITNPDFAFNGRVLGLLGNIQAYLKNVRYIDRDLNRIWKKKNVERLKNNSSPNLSEERELLELLKIIETEIAEFCPEKVIILDLHTTSSAGGIFSIPGKSQESFDIATRLHAPVIDGMLAGISGTTMHYCTKENLGIETHGVIFESGQHDDPLSVNRAIAGIINCLRSVGSVNKKDVENIHDKILLDYSRNLPPVSRLLYKHDLRNSIEFKMADGFNNFQAVSIGELLGTDRNGPVFCPVSGRILMPLYQNLGNEGFFIVEEALNGTT